MARGKSKAKTSKSSKVSVGKIFFFTRIARFLIQPTILVTLLFLTSLFTVAGATFYVTLPETQQEEISRIVKNWWCNEKQVSFWDVLEDAYCLRLGSREFVSEHLIADTIFSLSRPRCVDDQRTITLLANQYFCVGYVENQGNPAWVAYELRDMPAPLPRLKRPNFKTDTRTRSQIRPDDYTHSGYDRGHMAPNFSMSCCYGKAGQSETFLMSNIVPQKHTMNAGVWKTIEELEFLNLAARYECVWIVTGPIYNNANSPKLNHKVNVPDACFKIIVMRNTRGVFARAYIVPNGETASNPEKYRVSIDEIEKQTRLDFFAELPDDLENALEAHI